MHILLLLALPAAMASSSGRTGSSTTGCSCHGSSADATTTAAFSVGSTTVSPGDAVRLALDVTSSDRSRAGAGLDVSASGGVLVAGRNTQVLSGEITHSAPAKMVPGTPATFDFSWTAPSTPGTYTLYAAANAVDFDGSAGGDGWNLATLLLEVVGEDAPDTDGDGYAEEDGDCDDTDPSIHPDAEEVCDDLDQDCDGTIDEGLTTVFYVDDDQDTYGLTTTAIALCENPGGMATVGEDCDDGDPNVHPGAVEDCDGVDDDCNGAIDDGAQETFYADADSDGYGDPGAPVEACAQPSGTASDATDCDDDDASRHPGAEDIADDGVDQDCDGSDATGGDTDDTSETDAPDDTQDPQDDTGTEKEGGCGGCATGTSPRGWAILGMLGLALTRLRTRRRRS